jgi:acetyl-CoA/propionyl-CoA carboxylase biotin carboxyl carrier protein
MKDAVFSKVLIANRGEIALRIIRTLREMGIRSVAVYSDADRDAPFVEQADEAYRLGPPPATDSYLNVGLILSIAHQARAQAIHPGYGFLAENAAFAESVTNAGMTFIGPSAQSISLMGDKVLARAAVRPLNVPVVPGSDGPVAELAEALRWARAVGYPVAVKASGGGGGRGIRLVRSPDEMADAMARAGREAAMHFKSAELYIEKYFDDPRHIEVQVLGDMRGNLVHLGERDCSVQRRHQKLLEEMPSPAVDRIMRARLGDAALRTAQATQYFSAGTVEFLVTREGEFYFLEMNTRIQVEHTVTESVSGVDLIREMLLVAAGEPISVGSSLLSPHGHAIEIRVNAEDPADGFRATPAVISRFVPPGGAGIRVDAGVEAGFAVPPHYDSLLAKLIVWAPDREQARARALRGLDEFHISGPCTTVPFARAVLQHPVFASGDAGTLFVERYLEDLLAGIEPSPNDSDAAYVAGAGGNEHTYHVEVNRKHFRVKVSEPKERQVSRQPHISRHKTTLRQSSSARSQLLSPMHGTVVGIRRKQGDAVMQGDPLFVIEAMKMENEVSAHRTGKVKSISVKLGDTVEIRQELAMIE